MIDAVNSATIDPRARAFVEARSAARCLPSYPGVQPATLAEAYTLQDQAMRMWPDAVAGWKVGRIPAPWSDSLGTDRLVGPIFGRAVFHQSAGDLEMPLFSGGFGAAEGELVLVTNRDVLPTRKAWTLDEALALIDRVHLGIEVASSPFPGINDFGPLVTISDFGNNNGLILGPVLPWHDAASIGAYVLQTRIDGQLVGSAAASTLPGGPVESFRALLEVCAARGLALPAGTLVSTGAITGVHVARAGQVAEVGVEGFPSMRCRFVEAAAHR